MSKPKNVDLEDVFHQPSYSQLLDSIPVLIPDFDSPFPVTGTGMENCFPKFWEREWKMPFPTFGNRKGNEKIIPNFWEQEWEAGIPGNGWEREFILTLPWLCIIEEDGDKVSRLPSNSLVMVQCKTRRATTSLKIVVLKKFF